MKRREFIKLLAGTAAGLALAPYLVALEKYLPKDHDYQETDTVAFWKNGDCEIGGVNFLQGKVAMVRMWNRCLSQEELQAMYDKEKSIFDGYDNWEYVVLKLNLEKSELSRR